MTIADKLQLTLDNKNAVKLALQNKGANPTDVFSTYAGLIDGLATSGVTTPQIISPINGATGVSQSPIVTASRFSGLDPDGFADVHVASTWEFASDAAFTNILHTSGRDTVNLDSYDTAAAGVKFEGITVYARVTYEGQSGNVATSAAVSFETIAIGLGVVIDGDIVAGQVDGYWVLVAPATKRGEMQFGLYGTVTSLRNLETTYQASYPNSGEYNTDVLVSGYGSAAIAADYCRNDLDKPYSLPNLHELKVVMQNYEAIDASDQSGGAYKLASMTTYIWTSTEYDSAIQWCIRLDDRFGYTEDRTQAKSTVRFVVPCRYIPA